MKTTITPKQSSIAPLQEHIDRTSQELLASFPNTQQLSAVKLLLMMAFFEGWITRFMPYLAELARCQGSAEREYTDVHGVCDVVHTQELFRALQAEMTLAEDALPPAKSLIEGVEVLRTLIQDVVTA